MVIDGRDIGRAEPDKDPYSSPVLRILASAIVLVPLAGLVWLAYWMGTWMGGAVGGWLSVVSTALTVAVLWFWMRRKRR